MNRFIELFRREPLARRFLAAHGQSSLGTGLGYVALLTIAFDRSHSAWAVSAILVAEFAPAAVLGSVIGVLADRFPRRTMMIGADLLRCAAFVALTVTSAPILIVALALVAGLGNAVFMPCALAGLPTVVSHERLSTATAVFGTIDELGYLLGPALAAGLLLLVGVPALLLVNAATFLVSAAVLTRLSFGGGSPGQQAVGKRTVNAGWMRSMREGLSALADERTVAPLLLTSASFVVFLGGVNVGELLLARQTLHTGAGGYAVIVAAMAAGISIGALASGRIANVDELRRGYLLGLAACASGLVLAGFAPVFAVAMLAFFVTGLGNGAAVCCERVLLQRLVPDRLRGRIFGLRSSLISCALGLSFALAGTLGALLGARTLLLVTGAGALCAATAAWLALRDRPSPSSIAANLLRSRERAAQAVKPPA
jgi:MFS family permease